MYFSIMIILTFVVIAGFCIQPLFFPRMAQYSPEESTLNSLKRKKKILYRQIKEAEMEYEMGNLSEEDFIRTRQMLKQEVSQTFEEQRNNKKN